nr:MULTISPECIES: class I SAM-dependent methyltransferase [unclassified Desulfovibrio]
MVELACGHGRHVPKYMEDAGHITLVDVNQENIDFCQRRFNGNSKISFSLTSGNTFQGLPDAAYSAIFSYDSMMHFNLIDVATYINDAWRILKPGGKILFHHSNYYDAPVGNFYFQNPYGRNFCSDRIFAHLATTGGFEVLSQDLIDWGADNPMQGLDCLSLCQKREDYFSPCQKAMEERKARALAQIRQKMMKRL